MTQLILGENPEDYAAKLNQKVHLVHHTPCGKCGLYSDTMALLTSVCATGRQQSGDPHGRALPRARRDGAHSHSARSLCGSVCGWCGGGAVAWLACVVVCMVVCAVWVRVVCDDDVVSGRQTWLPDSTVTE